MNELHFLTNISEEEKDGTKWLANSIFWRYFENINRRSIYRTSSLEYRTVKLLVCEAMFYFCMLFMLTIYAYHFKSPEIYATKDQQRMYWGDCDAVNKCRLDNVTTHEAFYDWMRNDFIEKAFMDSDEYFSWVPETRLAAAPAGTNETVEIVADLFALNQNSVEWKPRYVSDSKTIILVGNVRVRQVRVKPNGPVGDGGCEIDIRLTNEATDSFECYPRYTEGRESILAYWLDWTLHKQQYVHRTPAETNQIPMDGYYSSYGGGGFFFDLKLKKSDAIQHLTDLQEWSWLDRASRAVIVEFSVVNPNMNLLASHRILFEFGPTGSRPMHQVFPFRVITLSLSYLDIDDQLLFILQCFVMTLFILYYFYVAVCMWKSGWGFFAYPWNLLDLIIIVVSIFHIAQQSSVYSTFASEPTFQPTSLGHPEIFAPFSKMIDPIRRRDNSLAFVCLFCWLRSVKYFTLIQSFRLLVRVLERTIYDLVAFGALLLIIFTGFSIAFHSGFGHLPPFVSVESSFYSLFFMLARSTDISGLFEASWLGDALFCAYLIIVYFLLFNMFMAIVIDTVSIATLLKRNLPVEDSPLACFLVAYFNRLRGISLTGSERVEDIGTPEEQYIQTCLLPQPIVDAWINKHDEMLKIVRAQGYKVEIRNDVVSRVQLQRVLDDEDELVEWLRTSKALDVIRRFRVPEAKNVYEEVAKMQANVFDKLTEIENSGNTLEFDNVESLRMVSTGLHDALTDLQSQWRKELTSVLEVISTLAEHVQMLCSKLERVQLNHLMICQMVDGSPEDASPGAR